MLILLPLMLIVGQAAPVVVTMAEPDPKKMSRSEIRAFNAALDRKHPFYIDCRRSATIGSLVERTYSCRTNAQWARADVKGNDNARETMDAMASKAGNSSN